MEEEGTPREAVQVGQQISGTGRLFAQQEPRNPGGVNQRIQALEQGYELSGYILPGWTVHGKPVFSPGEWLRTVREDLLAHMERVFGESAPLFQGILLGERQKMDADVITAMRLTGTVHILTVSGMHLSLLAMAVAWVLRRLPIGRWFRFGMQIALLTFFACLTGGAPGTIRALIMATMRALAVCRGQRYDPLTSLSAAALIMTLVNPLRTLTASFQFSFFVVLGILLLANGLHGVQTKRLAVARRFPALGVCASGLRQRTDCSFAHATAALWLCAGLCAADEPDYGSAHACADGRRRVLHGSGSALPAARQRLCMGILCSCDGF